MVTIKGLTIVVLTLALAPLVWSDGLSYRYRDNAGITHIGYSVPPQFLANGYEVLNDHGRVIEVVPPKQVLDAHAREAQQQEQRRLQLEKQREKDQALLRFYSSVADIERVRDRKLTEFDNFIEIQKANIVSYKKRVANLQGQAADLERRNRPVPQDILNTLETLEQKIADAEAAIATKLKEKHQVAQTFAIAIERLNFLLNGDDQVKVPDGQQ